MRRECQERFPRHRGLAIPTCITARAVSYEVGGGENVPGIPGACAILNFTYLVRGPWGHGIVKKQPEGSYLIRIIESLCCNLTSGMDRDLFPNSMDYENVNINACSIRFAIFANHRCLYDLLL